MHDLQESGFTFPTSGRKFYGTIAVISEQQTYWVDLRKAQQPIEGVDSAWQHRKI